MNLVTFSSEHIQCLERAQFLLSPLDKMSSASAEQLKYAGPAYTLINNKTLLGSGGVASMWGGVGSAWLIIYKQNICSQDRIHVARYCHMQLWNIIRLQRLHRVQAQVHSKFRQGQRFAEWMGFKYEGVAFAYGADRSDWLHYALTVK